MLHWTAAGAVAAPSVVQIRVAKAFSGRIAAGAPEPTRALTSPEIAANLRHFTIDRRGPRANGCVGVVLSGLEVGDRPEIGGLLSDSRGWGVTRATLHLARGDREALLGSPIARAIDAVALTVRDDRDLADAVALSRGSGVAPLEVTAVVLLDDATLPRLDHLAAGLASLGSGGQVVFTWPIAALVAPPHADRVAAALIDPIARLDAAGVRVVVKGLPACRLGPLSSRTSRSGNRWYVDADHQRGRALLFFPDVASFVRVDECRRCGAADRCDGVAEAWARARLVGPLRALQEPS